MPLYTYTCPDGHSHDRVRRMADTSIRCPDCGREAGRCAVYRNTTVQKWASEFHMPSSMKAAHEEAKGYAAEAKAGFAEERANGYSLAQEK